LATSNQLPCWDIKRLQGSLRGLIRLYIHGNWRVVFRVDRIERTIIVLRFEPQGSVYRLR
jgi:mRNA-degrading endonuclease RelE of RelBE toxin-antitoxin system